ncbi:hypothetical protein GW17_00052144 [Ensete ventricosum]|nr:hypothetical protein GW17_00052144 [Ensete ventricosum]
MLGLGQVRASSRGSNVVVGTRQKLTEEIGGLLGVRWKLVEGLSELAESDRELTGNASGVRQKMTETLREFAEDYREDRR